MWGPLDVLLGYKAGLRLKVGQYGIKDRESPESSPSEAGVATHCVARGKTTGVSVQAYKSSRPYKGRDVRDWAILYQASDVDVRGRRNDCKVLGHVCVTYVLRVSLDPKEILASSTKECEA